MSFNLLTTPWLSVRRASGTRARIRPAEVTDRYKSDPIVALDFPRADWNAALTEWLVGLAAVAFPPADEDQWREDAARPPNPERLRAALRLFEAPFEFTGEGPRAFQDLSPLGGEVRALAGLLIDAPGEITVRRNADLFVKRGQPRTLSLAYAAAALVTLQSYAPSGGSGHRTSLRGGGPLTTLIVPKPDQAADATLWQIIWANTPYGQPVRSAAEIAACLPWLTATRTSEAGQVVEGAAGDPRLAFFGCPRRIRLEFGHGACSWGDGEGAIAIGLRTRPHGPSYRHWRHPLSPYRADPSGALVAIHPRSETFDTGSFVAFWGLHGRPAQGVAAWQGRRRPGAEPATAVIQAFGYDMDNMKARQWLSRPVPWLPLYQDTDESFRQALLRAAAGLDSASRTIVHGLRIAVFGQAQGTGHRIADGQAGEAYRDIGEQFRGALEPDFIMLAGQLQPAAGDREATMNCLTGWFDRLRAVAPQAFDRALDLQAIAMSNTRRLAAARGLMASAFGPRGAVRRAMDLTGPG